MCCPLSQVTTTTSHHSPLHVGIPLGVLQGGWQDRVKARVVALCTWVHPVLRHGSAMFKIVFIAHVLARMQLPGAGAAEVWDRPHMWDGQLRAEPGG